MGRLLARTYFQGNPESQLLGRGWHLDLNPAPSQGETLEKSWHGPRTLWRMTKAKPSERREITKVRAAGVSEEPEEQVDKPHNGSGDGAGFISCLTALLHGAGQSRVRLTTGRAGLGKTLSCQASESHCSLQKAITSFCHGASHGCWAADGIDMQRVGAEAAIDRAASGGRWCGQSLAPQSAQVLCRSTGGSAQPPSGHPGCGLMAVIGSWI